MPRKQVNLHTLPIWAQYLLSLSVVAIVVTAAWVVGREKPVPVWVTKYLAPALAIIFVALLCYAIFRRFSQKR